MALDKSVNLDKTNARDIKYSTFACVAGDYYRGEYVMVGGDDNLAKPLSGSSEADNTFVGVVYKEQLNKAANSQLTVARLETVVSGAGFSANDAGKLAYADSSAGVTAARSEGQLPVGKFVGFEGELVRVAFDITPSASINPVDL